MASRTHEPEPLLTPAEVASMFRVDPKTVTRWAKAGKLSAIRTLGGHRRHRDVAVAAYPLDLAAVRRRPHRERVSVADHPGRGGHRGTVATVRGQQHVLPVAHPVESRSRVRHGATVRWPP